MTEKRYELVKDYDCDGNWEYAYQNNDTGRRYNFADGNCDYDFLNDVNSTYEELKKENEQLKSIMKEVIELLEEEVDVFSDKALEHDLMAYRELQQLDNKDAYDIATGTKKAIRILKEMIE